MTASRMHSMAWIVTAVLGIFMLASGLFIVSQGVNADDFESTTGIELSVFEASSPEAADYLEKEARLGAVSFAVLGGVALALAFSFLRSGSKTGWTIALFMPVAFAGVAAVFFTADAEVLGGFYAGLAAIATVVVLVGRSKAWQ